MARKDWIENKGSRMKEGLIHDERPGHELRTRSQPCKARGGRCIRDVPQLPPVGRHLQVWYAGNCYFGAACSGCG
jgi:hypothetical protein